MSNEDQQRLAALAAGDVAELGAAVVDKLLALATDRVAFGQSRAEAIRGLAVLGDAIPPPGRAIHIWLNLLPRLIADEAALKPLHEPALAAPS